MENLKLSSINSIKNLSSSNSLIKENMSPWVFFPSIILVVIIFIALLVISSLFNLSFKTEKNQKLTKNLTFNSKL